MLKRNNRGVPLWAVLASTLGGYVCVAAVYLSPDNVFSFLLNSSGSVVRIIYLLICLSQRNFAPDQTRSASAHASSGRTGSRGSRDRTPVITPAHVRQ
jgi:L-asparagine transporter-like permease